MENLWNKCAGISFGPHGEVFRDKSKVFVDDFMERR